MASALQKTDAVLVIGGAGRSGRLIMAQLDTAGVTTVGLTRDPVAAAANLGQYRWRAGNVVELAMLEAALRGISYVVFSAAARVGDPAGDSSAVDCAGVANLVKVSVAAGIKQIVLLSSLNVSNPERVPMLPLQVALRWKKLGEDCLRASGIPYTIIRPGRLVDELDGVQSYFLDQGDRIGGAVTSRHDLATVTVAALGNPDAFNTTCEIFNFVTGFEIPVPVSFADLRKDPLPVSGPSV